MIENKTLVIIVTYNGMQWLDRCLKSLENSDMSLDIIVIDNGSDDGSQEFITTNFSFVHFIQSEKNLGFGAANNIGLKYALDNNYNYVYLLNQDAWVMPNTISTMIEVQKRNLEYGILSPIQTNAEMTKLDRNFAFNCIAHTHLVSGFVFNNLEELYEVPSIMAAHWLISRNCLSEIGGFSWLFFHYGEDNDYLNRAKFKNYKLGVVTSVFGVHDREYRPETKAKDIYMLKVMFMVRAANPNYSLLRSIFEAIAKLMIHSIHRAIKYSDIRIAFKYMFKVLYVCKINKCRKIAKYAHIPFLEK